MKKVLYVIPAMNSGGAQRLLVDICQELKRIGRYEPAIAILTNEPNRFESELSGITVKQFDIPKHVSILSLRRPYLRLPDDYLHTFKPDIIHTHVYFADLIVNQLTYTKAIFFSHIHGLTTQYDRRLFGVLPLKQKLIAHLERWLMTRAYDKRTTTFLAVSEEYVNYTRQILPEFRQRIHLLHNGIKLYPYDDAIKTAPQGLLRIICVGRLEQVKGVDFTLLVAKELKSNKVNFILDIFGEGEMRSYLHKKISELELQEYVHLRGFSSQIQQEYPGYDIYLQTSLKESFGLTLVEAMAAGLPVVCTDGGGNRDIVNDGVNGFLVKERNEKILAHKILQLAHDANTYRNMSQAAQATAKKFSIERCVDNLLHFYESSFI